MRFSSTRSGVSSKGLVATLVHRRKRNEDLQEGPPRDSHCVLPCSPCMSTAPHVPCLPSSRSARRAYVRDASRRAKGWGSWCAAHMRRQKAPCSSLVLSARVCRVPGALHPHPTSTLCTQHAESPCLEQANSGGGCLWCVAVYCTCLPRLLAREACPCVGGAPARGAPCFPALSFPRSPGVTRVEQPWQPAHVANRPCLHP